MPDRLYLSLWLRGFAEGAILGRLETLLGVFPFSRQRPGISALRIYALEFAEPALFEQLFAGEPDIETVIGLAGEFHNPDCAYVVEGWWDLWQYRSAGWELAPARVTLICFGPEFDNEVGDHLRIELGTDLDFLPRPEAPQSARRMHSNLQSVVRLARDLEQALPMERRRLWTESGEDLAARLEEVADELE